jgi:GNAT superfamily N-acetyltransferase
MFASVDLALRIDTAEARLSRSIALGLPEGSSPDQAPFVIPVGSGYAVFAKPGSPMNKVIGIGIDAPLTPAEMDRVEDAFRGRNEDTRVELSTLALPHAGELLSARGYRLQGFENVLGLDLRAEVKSARGSGVVVAQVRDGALSPWLEILVDGFATPDDTGVAPENFPRAIVEDATRDFARSPEVQRYVAWLSGEAVGSASMRVDGAIAAMCGAATLPAHRKRGVQQALLSSRVDDARAAGCDLAVITTAPGTRSQANAHRRGFHLLYARAVLVRPLHTQASRPPAS